MTMTNTVERRPPVELTEGATLPAAAQQWLMFIEAMEEMYGSLAIVQGEPSARHTPGELRVVAEIAASLGIRPDDAPVQMAQAAGADEST